ncbi:two-component system response regulator [Clostridia bacterium]|nr:two-component system response regulator [Clostridia bacterium]
MKKNTILIVDDLEVNRWILAESFGDSYDILEADGGEQALVLLEQYKNDISVILLDLIMPGMDGYEILAILKTRDIMHYIPVILITGDTSEDMQRRGFDLGVSDIVTKPFDMYVVKRRVENIMEMYRYRNNLEEMLEEKSQELQHKNRILEEQAKALVAFNDAMIDSIANLVEFRNMETGHHVKQVKRFSRTLADALIGNYPEYEIDDHKAALIEQAAAVHDLGKIMVSDTILLKPGRLTKEEFEIMKTHSVKGTEILERFLDFPDKEYYEYCWNICRYHHERYDGNGYPDHLKGEEIPIAAQIVSIADVYEALVSKRVYKAPYDKDTAYNMIMEGQCGVFSPKLLECFTRCRAQFEQFVDAVDREKEKEENAKA